MSRVRNTGFVVSLALLASLVGHFAIQRHFERRSQTKFSLEQKRLTATAAKRFGSSFDVSELGDLKMPRFMDSIPHHGQIIPALDSDELNSQNSKRRMDRVPAAVPDPSDAIPLEKDRDDESFAHDADTSAVRDVIEHELSHATREERDIWFEELKSLPAGVVSDLLQVRKQLHALPKLLGGMPEKLASADPTLSTRTQEIAAEPASQKIRFNLPSDHVSTSAALEAAISQLRHNLTNAATPGFKRFRVTLVDAYSASWQDAASADNSPPESLMSNRVQGDGCRIAPLLLDLQQGSLKKTSRQLDLAIDGEGFFAVRVGDKDFLTRCGAFTLDHNRQICLSVTNENAVLQPVVVIPEDAREIQISAGGVVTVLRSADTSLNPIGQLQVARVPSPARLQPAGHTLFLANHQSGAAEFAKPNTNGLGELQQGFVEQSNVDYEREMAEIEGLFSIINAMPLQGTRPATARSLQRSLPR